MKGLAKDIDFRFWGPFVSFKVNEVFFENDPKIP